MRLRTAARDVHGRAMFCVALTTLVFAASAGVRRAEACLCNENPPCAAVWSADAVFVGTVIDRVEEEVGGSISWTVQKVVVNERLHGTVDTPVITIVPDIQPSAEQVEASKSSPARRWFGSSCDYNFQLGRQYVIYARKTGDGRWMTSKCSGTKPLEKAEKDFDYIATIPAGESTGRVYGRIERTVVNPANRSSTEVVPASGIAVALSSANARLTTTTDSEGKLDVRVPPGDYTIVPVVPQTIRVYGAPLRASVHARGCAPVYFSLTANGRIEGRVVRSDGTPAARTSVDVVPADLPPGESLDNPTTSRSELTDEDGQFSIDAILPGRYLVAVHARSSPRLDSPYLPTYFQGAEGPRIIELGEGERKTGFTIVVSPLAETTVSGVVLVIRKAPPRRSTTSNPWEGLFDFALETDIEHDRLVVVTAAPVDHRGAIMASAKADGTGSFELRLLAGIRYLVRAGIQTKNGFRQTETVVLVNQRVEGLRLSIVR